MRNSAPLVSIHSDQDEVKNLDCLEEIFKDKTFALFLKKFH